MPASWGRAWGGLNEITPNKQKLSQVPGPEQVPKKEEQLLLILIVAFRTIPTPIVFSPSLMLPPNF